MTINLHETGNPINRHERNKINENWQRITEGLNKLQRQIYILAGSQEVDEILERINTAVENAEATTADMILLIVEANTKISEITQAISESQEVTDTANSIINQLTALKGDLESLKAELEGISEAESTRKANENARINAENVRKSNEDTRQSNEQIRQVQEETRQQNEANRQTTFDNQMQQINTVLPHVMNLENAQTWNSTKQYYKNNIVEYEGSSFMALKDSKGKLPPTLPTKQNEYWMLLAQRGVDGQGAVSKVNGKLPDVNGNVELNPSDIGAASNVNLISLEQTVNEHLADDVSKGEVHGLRVFNGKLEYFDGQQWQRVKLDEQRIYGVRIDRNNSNPETRVTYIGDAVGFTPMRGNNGNFSWGSWQNVFESFEIRPVVLQNRQVQYYLDPNDFTKKIDGSPANLTGADGDVMIEFGKILWWKWTDEGTTYTIEISDKAFDGAVKHAFEIEEGYNLVPYYPLLLTQILFVIFFKSTDSQTALGRGYVDGNTNYASTGNTNNRGMFYGSGSGSQQMKFLGIEDYWGNKFWRIDGLVTDSNYNLLIGKGSFNDNGSGYQTFASGVSSNTSGYIDSVQGGNDKGFIIKSGSGSETTYYADYGYLYSNRVAHFGSSWSNGSNAGFSYLRLSNSGSYSDAAIGARLFCASNGKIYIGAYLGTSVDGKLRSISGTSEPTGSKTIGTFRTEARANN